MGLTEAAGKLRGLQQPAGQGSSAELWDGGDSSSGKRSGCAVGRICAALKKKKNAGGKVSTALAWHGCVHLLTVIQPGGNSPYGR